jgi:DNA-binding NarL/FixJ family response regulator
MSAILAKLDLEDRTQAALFALRSRLVDRSDDA